MYVVVFIVCLLASMVGAVCGIGGGVIIKPVLDAFELFGVSEISFLSGCTVLSMTTYSVARSKFSGESHVRTETSLPLALGAAAGGLLGKQLFCEISEMLGAEKQVGLIQSACLLIVTVGTLLYTIYKDRIPTRNIKKAAGCVAIGVGLGMLSAFLGIGGGPMNLVVLYYFFSMGTREAAENSLYIIFFSQLASLMLTLVTKSVPKTDVGLLLLMAAGGIAGRTWNQRLRENTVNGLFMALMAVIILINLHNIYVFL